MFRTPFLTHRNVVGGIDLFFSFTEWIKQYAHKTNVIIAIFIILAGTFKKGATRIRTWVNRNLVNRGFKTCHLNRWIIAPITFIKTNSLLIAA